MPNINSKRASNHSNLYQLLFFVVLVNDVDNWLLSSSIGFPLISAVGLYLLVVILDLSPQIIEMHEFLIIQCLGFVEPVLDRAQLIFQLLYIRVDLCSEDPIHLFVTYAVFLDDLLGSACRARCFLSCANSTAILFLCFWTQFNCTIYPPFLVCSQGCGSIDHKQIIFQFESTIVDSSGCFQIVLWRVFGKWLSWRLQKVIWMIEVLRVLLLFLLLFKLLLCLYNRLFNGGLGNFNAIVFLFFSILLNNKLTFNSFSCF